MDPYDARHLMLESLTNYSLEHKTKWRVAPACGYETYVHIIIPGNERLALHLEYALRSNNTDEKRDISGIFLVKNGRFVSSSLLGFKREEGIHKDKMMDINKLVPEINKCASLLENTIAIMDDGR